MKENVNFDVIQIPAKYKFKDSYKESPILLNIRSDTGEMLGSVRKTYNLVDHKQTIQNATKALELSGLFQGNPKHTIINNGSRIVSEFLFSKEKVEIIKKDDLRVKLFLYNSYDGSTTVQFLFGIYRIICSNGAMVPVREVAQIKWRHQKSFNIEKFSNEVLQATKDYKEEVLEKITSMVDEKITDKQALNFVEKIEDERLISKKHGEMVMEYFEHPKYDIDKLKNLWILYNAFTYVYTHHIQYNIQLKNVMTSKIFNILNKN